MKKASPDTRYYESRVELERLWLLKVQAALARFRLAEKHHRQMAEKLALKLIAPSDGALAVASAGKVEAAALAEYERLTRIYVDLVANGKIPSPDDG